MTTEGLHIAPGFTLPLDAVTETFAILAKRRAGKSNAAVVIAEEMYDHGLPWVAIDPKGDWWGVRAAGDGETPGLAVLVFGGLHGDVPLEPASGGLVADLIIGHRLTAVLDVSEMTKADQRRFLIDFTTRLYQRNTEPLHVFCEEADEYISQRVTGENAKLVGAFETLVKRGGFRGIGVTLITQRSASLNKDVLTQIETLIPMRTPSPQDRKAILAWVDVHASGTEAVNDLPGLADGEAWVFSPQWLDTLVKIRFRRRRTFDSGATPKVGQKPRQPTNLADVDVAAIKDAMADTIEKSQADDPKVLRALVADLRRQLAARPAPEPVRVEVSVLTDEDRALLVETQDALRNLVHVDLLSVVFDKAAAATAPAPRTTTRTSTPPLEPTMPTVVSGDPSTGLPKMQEAILRVLAHGPLTQQNAATISGYRISGSWRNNLSRLRVLGYVEGSDTLTITPAGRAAAGPIDPLPTGAALREHWKQHSSVPHMAGMMLDALAAAWPGDLSPDELAERTGYAQSGSFRNNLSRLRSLGLAHGKNGAPIRIDPTLMDGDT